ncbi:pol polyprotein, partial [Aphelenchoides avenae]
MPDTRQTPRPAPRHRLPRPSADYISSGKASPPPFDASRQAATIESSSSGRSSPTTDATSESAEPPPKTPSRRQLDWYFRRQAGRILDPIRKVLGNLRQLQQERSEARKAKAARREAFDAQHPPAERQRLANERRQRREALRLKQRALANSRRNQRRINEFFRTIDMVSQADFDDLKNNFEALKKKGSGKVPSVDLPTYEGRADEKTFREFLDKFYLVGNLYGWDNARCCQIIPTCLRGEALAVYQTLPNATKAEWDLLTEELAAKLITGDDDVQQQQALNRRFQRPNESVAEFGLAIKALVKRAFPTSRQIGTAKPFTEEFQSHQAVNHFIAGLKPNIKEHLLRGTRPASLEAAISAAIVEEQTQRALREDYSRNDAAVAVVRLEANNEELKTKVDDLREKFEQVSFVAKPTAPEPIPQAPQWSPPQYVSGMRRSVSQNFTPMPPRRNNFNQRFDQFRNRSWRPNFNFGRRPNPGRYNQQRRDFGRDRNNYGNNRNNYGRSRNDYGRDRSQQQGPPTDNRDRRDNSNSQRRVRFQTNAILPVLAVLALLIGSASGQYQICSVTRGSYYLEKPQTQSCEPPPSDEAQHVVVELFVPKTTPTLVEAYHCTNVTTTTCSKSALFMIAKEFQKPPLQQSVSAELCWKMVNTYSVTDNLTLTAEDLDLWRTDEKTEIPRRFWGEACDSVNNFVVQKGSIGTLDGKLLSSDLSPHLNCSILDLACNDTKGTTVWKQPSIEAICRYEKAGEFSALMTNTHVLVDEIQAAFITAKDQNFERQGELGCLPERVIRMENEVFARFFEPNTWYLGHPRTQRRYRRKVPAYECDDVEPEYKTPPLPRRLRPLNDLPQFANEDAYIILREGKYVWYQHVRTNELVEELPQGAAIIYPNGTREVLRQAIPNVNDAGYYTINGERLYWTRPPTPLFPGKCGCRSHRAGWPYLGPRRVMHHQYTEEYPQGNLTYDYFVGFNDRDILHPCDLPHGTVINYRKNGTQLRMFWENKKSFFMLRPSEYEQRESRRKANQSHAVQKRAVTQRPVDEAAEREAVRIAHLQYCKRINYDDNDCLDANHANNGPHEANAPDRAGNASNRAIAPVFTASNPATSQPTRGDATYAQLTKSYYTDKFTKSTAAKLAAATTTANHPAVTTRVATSTNDHNARLQWLEDKMANETRLTYERLWRHICRLHNVHITHSLSMLRIDATIGVREFLQRDDVHASVVGEVIAVSPCTQVVPAEIYWNHKVNATCYQDIPVKVNDTIWFIQTGTRELVKESARITCDKRPVSIYKDAKGIWRTDAGNVAQVASLKHRLMFRGQLQPVELTAPTIFNSDTATVAAIASSIARYADRINRAQKTIDAISSHSSVSDIGVALDDFGTAANNTFHKAISTTKGWLTDLKDAVDDWRHLVILILCVALLAMSAAGCVYFAPCWMPFVQAMRAPRNRRNSVELTGFRRRGKYRRAAQPVNAIELIRTERPSAPSTSASLLTYYPECCSVAFVNGQGQLRVPVTVDGISVEALLDTGSSITYCRKDLSDLLRSNLHPTSVEATAANGTRIKFHGEFPANIEFGAHSVHHSMIVSPNEQCPAPMILGTDFLKLIPPGERRICVDLDTNTASIGTQHLQLLSAAVTIPPKTLKARAAETTILAPRSDNVILAKVELDESEDKSEETSYLVYPATHSYRAITVGAVLVTLSNTGLIPLRVLNSGMNATTIYQGSTLGTLEAVHDDGITAEVFRPGIAAVTECSPTVHYTPPEANWSDKLPQTLPPLDEQIQTKLDLSQSILSTTAQADLRTIIQSRQQAFVADDGRIGCYNGPITHRIDLVSGAKPTQQRPYRTPLTLRDEVQRQVEDMLRQHIIRPSTSPFCSPIVMVKKADGKSWRFAVDYRALNNITQKQTSYLPLIQDILDSVGGKRYYSNFDFQSGFHQIPVEPEHVERTAFATFLGLFEFLRMPFGLCSAPATFQRVMESMRRELTAAFFIYLDDVVLASLTEKEHLRDIDQFLDVIIRRGMKLRLDKCAFGRAEIKYLGFLISQHGIRPDPKSVDSVKAMKPPKTLTELRSFIGAVSYFRRFIANFATIMQPLYALTKKEAFSEWTEEHQKAFDTVVQKLVTAPVLAPPRLGRSFIIETDASSTAIAACLLQQNPQGEIHPIAYASRLLNKHEARYPSVESEALALVFALREYAPYIEGSGTTVIRTDNSALPALLKKRDLAGRLAKYQMTIQAFDVTIEHRSGKSNTFCDHLSRYPNPSISVVTRAQERQNPGMLHHPSFGSLSAERLRNEQRQVAKFRDLYDAVRHQRYPTNADEATLVRRHEKDYTVRNGLLCYAPKDSDDAPRILVPYTLREAIIGYFHQPPLEGAHLGADKTIQRIRARFHWPGMTEDVQTLISACLQCQKRKTPPRL